MTLSQRFDLILVRRSDLERYIDDLIEHRVQDRVEDRVERHVERYVRRYVGSTIAGLESRIRTLTGEMTILGERMTSMQETESAKWAELGRVAGLVIAEVASLKEQVQRIGDAEAQADVERIDGLLGVLSGALPVEVPPVPVPDPGVPATDPGSGATSDDVVDGSAPPAEGSGDAPSDGGDAPSTQNG